MSIWVGVVVLVAALLVAALVWKGKEGRVARRELRRLRAEEGFGPNTYGAAEARRNMTMDPLPGKGTTPGGP